MPSYHIILDIIRDIVEILTSTYYMVMISILPAKFNVIPTGKTGYSGLKRRNNIT